MSEAIDEVTHLVRGRWRSQILYSGAELAVFDHLTTGSFTPAEVVARKLQVDPVLLYRLMRALASLELLVENDSRCFATNEKGELLRSDHPQSLRNMVLLVECPEHYVIWKHLPDLIRDGKQDGFVREFGVPAFEFARTNERYRRVFDQGMTAHSVAQSNLVLEALRDYDFSSTHTICDVGGGHGYLICMLLKAFPHLIGSVLDLPEVFSDLSKLWAKKLGLENRCTYVAGDMFKRVPKADTYSLKMILHDWNDQECIEILSCLRRASTGAPRVFIIEHIVPGPSEPHFAKLIDIQMMCWGTGQERTEAEYIGLLESAGWKFHRTWYPRNRTIGVVEGRVLE